MTIVPSRGVYESVHSTLLNRALKLTLCVAVVLLIPRADAQSSQSNPAKPPLQRQLVKLLEAGQLEAAIRTVQDAMRQSPDDPVTRREYADLHRTLAGQWIAAGRFDDARAALHAVLAVKPDDAAARKMLGAIRTARHDTPKHLAEVDRLLEAERFEDALDLISQLHAVGGATDGLESRRQRARVGAADDHYLARNFREAFALYEHVLATDSDADSDVHTRWAISLALALAEEDFSEPMDPNAAGRLLARAIDVLRKTHAAIIGQIVGGMLAERAGERLRAAQTYSEALGEVWRVPPADRRAEVIRRLRDRAISAARAIYSDTPVGRRTGFWTISLDNAWKTRRTRNFVVFARNDLVAERVAQVAEFHWSRLCNWLGRPLDKPLRPRCEIRVHASRSRLHDATGTSGVTSAVGHTRVQGDRILLRRLHVFQSDPWLLSATLSHELTHIVVADLHRAASPPLAIDEGLALQSEPPARRLASRRALGQRAPSPGTLLDQKKLPDAVEDFYAHADALTAWLLECTALESRATTPSAVIGELLTRVRPERDAPWWRVCGFDSRAEASAAWIAWCAARGDPPRMPLMILVEPSAEHRADTEQRNR